MPEIPKATMLEHCPSIMPEACSSNALRTYERNSRTTTHLENQSHVGKRAQGGSKKYPPPEETTEIGAELAALVPVLDPTVERTRHPVHRTGRTEARTPIDAATRRKVYIRDHHRCVWCGSPDCLTLDHFTPWSALGSDDIDNLRTLCWACNGYRSNFRHVADERSTRILPVTFWCATCEDPDPAPQHPARTSVFCYWCEAPSVGIPSRWFKESNAFWDYDLNWHRPVYPGYSREAWEEACKRLKFPSLYVFDLPTEAVQRALHQMDISREWAETQTSMGIEASYA